LSCILNVKLYLTLERAREHILKEAIEAIKEQAGDKLADESLQEFIIEAD